MCEPGLTDTCVEESCNYSAGIHAGIAVIVLQDYYASVGGAPEAYGSHCVCPSVCPSVCAILQCAFLRDRNKLSNETTAQHSTTAKLARFLL